MTMRHVISAAPTIDVRSLAATLAGSGRIVSDPSRALCERYGYQTLYEVPVMLQKRLRRELIRAHAETLREAPDAVTQKIRTMQTDPARVRRSDPGDPLKCPVWNLHLVYSDEHTKEWAFNGCKTAGIGCLECKQPVIDAIIREQGPIRERAQRYLDDPQLVRNIVADGCERARKLAEETMRDVRSAMGLDYT